MEKLLLTILLILSLSFGTFASGVLADTPPTTQGNSYQNGQSGNSQSTDGTITSLAETGGSCIGSQLVSKAVLSTLGSLLNTDHYTRLNTVSTDTDRHSGDQSGITPSSDAIAYCIINAMIQYITTATVHWIDTGFDGNPAFVQDPKTFFSNLATNEVSGLAQQVIGQTTGVNICQPFRMQITTGLLGNQNNSDPSNQYGSQASCSLDQIAQAAGQSGTTFDYQGYTSGQSQSSGNLTGWYGITQNFQNNPYGATLMTNSELQRRIDLQQNQATLDLTTGNGFLSYRTCATGTTYTDNSGIQQTTGQTCKTSTPGSVIENQLNSRLSDGNNRLVLADKFDQVVSTLVNQLIQTALNQTLNSSQSTTQQ
jgi:hypothetical protein